MRNVASLATSSLLASVASAQVVQWDIQRRATPNAPPRLSRRADGSVQEVITNERMRGGYFASCTVGTPPQDVTLQLDTGSSDIWVPANTASVCEDTSQGGGCTFGSFDSDSSSSFNVLNDEFEISYVDGSGSRGEYISETFGIGDVKLENMTMGLGLSTDIAYGLVGVGYALNEASVSATHMIYNNLPVMMRDEGHIKSNAYSLWLNDLEASKGNILFGGVDTDKYMGDLVRVSIDINEQARNYTAFQVRLTSLEAHSSSGNDSLSSASFPIPVVLDSGTTFSYLPQDIAEQVWKEVGVEVTNVDGTGLPLIPCDYAKSTGYFSFGFGGDGGPVVNVGMDELAIPLYAKFPSGSQFAGQDACQFGIQNFSSDSTAQGEPFLLGDTFLRSAYVVYDLENNEIAIAQTDFNATTSNVVAFASQSASIPSSTPAPSQDAANTGPSSEPNYNAAKGFKDLSGSGTGSSSSSGSGSSGSGGGNGDNDSAGSLNPALDFTQIAVMGASMGLMMLGGGAFLLF
ncbi:aspartic peptidase domain-containing protein [Xylaria sp. FL0933]|nr:aspartic peptidase domain-containing protein [Xylaria sp. FL0933]